MANPTVASILTGAAQKLGDTAAEQYTSAVLLPYYGDAYREMFDLFGRWNLPVGELEEYALIPANTTFLTPSAVGIGNLGTPIELWERSSVSTFTVSGVTNATPMVVTTSAPHGLATGALVEIYNVVGPLAINQQWRVTVTGASTFSLNGSLAGGAYTSGGTVIVGGELSSNPFRLMSPRVDLPQIPEDMYLRYWKWENGSFFFPGATGSVELLIKHEASGDPPQSGSVGVDNPYNFLVFRTASLAAVEYGMANSAVAWKLEALGPSGEADGSGGALRGLANRLLKEKQKRPARSRPFREHRNTQIYR